jgi:rhodanese-related sulfurtransferase
MIFEQIATGGCQSYLIGCSETCVGAVIDPEVRQIDRYQVSAARERLRIRYVVDTHTHADHFSAARELGRTHAIPVVMHRDSYGYDVGHVPGARHLPRGQLELRVDSELTDSTTRIVTVCEFGKVSTLAAATLRELGFLRTAALDGGMQAWRESGFPIES